MLHLEFNFFVVLCLQHNKLQTMWRDVEGFNLQGTNSKLANFQSLFAVPSGHNVRAPPLPRHMLLDLSNMSCGMLAVLGLGQGAYPHGDDSILKS